MTIKYLVCQKEVAPSTGGLHVQGAIAFTEPTRMAPIQNLMPGVHLNPARDWTKLKEYCQKTETRVEGSVPFIHGEDTGQGHRSDLHEAVEAIKSGKRMRDIATEHSTTFVRAYKGLSVLQATLFPADHMERRCALFWGPTETGKTRMVFDNLPDVYTVFDIKHPWFEGYSGEENVLLDECGKDMMSVDFLKRLLDRYPMIVPIKGMSQIWRAKTIVMTSNTPLDRWYPGIDRLDFDALKRRMIVFKFPEEKWLAECWIKGQERPRVRPPLRLPVYIGSDSDDNPRLRSTVVSPAQPSCEDITDLMELDERNVPWLD